MDLPGYQRKSRWDERAQPALTGLQNAAITRRLKKRLEVPRMRRWITIGSCLLLSATLVGCVERRYAIESDPPGALVLVNGQPLGTTPVDGHFVYYGNYSFTLVKDGYETLQVDQRITSPWYQVPPVDFMSENLYPGKLEDVRRFRYALQPCTQVNTQQLLQQAEALRNRGQQIPMSEN
jgi:hypothetical protein